MIKQAIPGETKDKEANITRVIIVQQTAALFIIISFKKLKCIVESSFCHALGSFLVSTSMNSSISFVLPQELISITSTLVGCQQKTHFNIASTYNFVHVYIEKKDRRSFGERRFFGKKKRPAQVLP